MPVDYDALRGQGPASNGPPKDGIHVARLERAALVETGKGPRLVTEWSNQDHVYWTSWNRFDTNGLSYTQQLLDGLGVDRQTVNDDDELTDALANVEGRSYGVRTESQQGAQGDKWFTTTYIEDSVQGAQAALDIPFDAGELPEPRKTAPSAAAPAGDDDLPF